MKKIILATLISGAMSASALAGDAGSGTVTFNGSIIEAPCSIAPGEENENQTVELGQVSNVTLAAGGESSAQPFSIKLEGCNLENNNQVTVIFSGAEAVDGEAANTGLLQISGDAAGAAVKIMNSSNTQIKINDNDGYTRNYVQGNNELKFQAALKGLAGATVVPGNFSAVTNFTLAYN
ncbi:fimbrial protein [Providencia stuartii]|uniref:Fimbria A protein n=1 Tax=Providencia stuartii ATCC 25827 TaxID=471874 RepID=A0AA87CUB1_PROST|nr:MULTISPECIES: fimbrial protein [Providencia]EDU60705.1 fimbria A protein [Providencia stuartii ATCC 25827]MBS7784173.1 type 1 fimbrial protein [Providencia thailandensis]MTC82573.1 fimbrial protein [Providencia stuartii]MTC92274.1 fimbrial protein [Providencia stuartii]